MTTSPSAPEPVIHSPSKAVPGKESSAQAPSVSVLMAVYNGQLFLREALDSILTQTFTNFELVIVDDASTDETPVIVEAYARRDHRLVVLRNERNLKLAASLNRGLAVCRAPLVARADGDDLYHHGRLEKQWGFLEEHPGIGVVSCCFNRISAEGKFLDFQELPVEDGAIKFRMLWESSLSHAGVLYRQLVVREAGGYDESYATAQDYDLWARLMDRTAFANLAEPLLTVRLHGASSSTVRGAEQSRLAGGVSKRLLSRYLGKPLGDHEATALRTLLCAYEPVSADELSPALKLLDELLCRAGERENPGTLRWARRAICAALLKQAYYRTYRDAAGSWELLRKTARVSALRVFSLAVSVQMLRLLAARCRREAPRAT